MPGGREETASKWQLSQVACHDKNRLTTRFCTFSALASHGVTHVEYTVAQSNFDLVPCQDMVHKSPRSVLVILSNTCYFLDSL